MKTEDEICVVIDSLLMEYEEGIMSEITIGYLKALCWVVDTTPEEYQTPFK